jgi:HTH-type transcriptional regulator, competence development regulator
MSASGGRRNPPRSFRCAVWLGAWGSSPRISARSSAASSHPPGEETIQRIAKELGEDPDVLLALAGKVSADLLKIIRERPALIAELLRTVRRAPAKRIAKAVREVRDGEW